MTDQKRDERQLTALMRVITEALVAIKDASAKADYPVHFDVQITVRSKMGAATTIFCDEGGATELGDEKFGELLARVKHDFEFVESQEKREFVLTVNQLLQLLTKAQTYARAAPRKLPR